MSVSDGTKDDLQWKLCLELRDALLAVGKRARVICT
jgi:hypothetical protein